MSSVRISARLVNVRETPSATGRVVFVLKQGEIASLIESSGDWFLIQTATGRGYVNRAFVEAVEDSLPAQPPQAAPAQASAPTATGVAIDHSNVRCLPADRYTRIDACLTPPDQVGRAQVLFRALDTDPWYAVDLKPAGACRSTLLPRPLPTTSEVQYFIHVLDRSFGESQRPDLGAASPYRVKVVRSSAECGDAANAADGTAVPDAPILVAVVRDPAGAPLALGAAQALGLPILSGFAPQGVVVLGATAPFLPPAAPKASAMTSAPAPSPAGVSGGGLSGGALAAIIAGGAVVLGGAGAAVYFATKGGDESGSSSGSGSSSDGPVTISVNVSAAAAGVGTGLFVNAGSTLRISAPGTWYYGSYPATTADGVAGSCPDYSPEQGAFTVPCPCRIGSLIYMINMNFACGGSSVSTTAQSSGQLYLGFNDRRPSGYGDNRGSISATISVSSGHQMSQ